MARIERALISVSNKSGIVEFARELVAHGIELLSTGGTAALLREAALPVVDVADYTGFPEIMAGRVKTLHPKIAGGLLARTGIDDAEASQHDIPPISLLVVNLYPFEEAIAAPDCSLDDAIENIDIGGPSMIRAAAKNHDRVTVVTESSDYSEVLAALREHAGETTLELRRRLALRAFEHTAFYDALIADFLRQRAKFDTEAATPRQLTLGYKHRETLRYGENPHQSAALYIRTPIASGTVAAAEQLNGKALSYNNIADADAALQCVNEFDEPACVIVKHANPCGVALGSDIGAAYDRAFKTDPTSAFGGIIAVNRPLDATTAKAIIDRQFVEVIIAPSVDQAALAVVSTKQNVRLLAVGEVPSAMVNRPTYHALDGGLLVQDRDRGKVSLNDLRQVSQRAPTDAEIDDLLFAFSVVKFVKSNAIVYVRDKMTVGIGAGQMSRVYSARLGAMKAADEGLQVAGSVLASDAFFPFRDGIDAAAEVGVKAIIQPGGSVRDEEVIAAADEHGIAMVFTGMRHFRH